MINALINHDQYTISFHAVKSLSLKKYLKISSNTTFSLFSSSKYYRVDQIKNNEFGGACGTYGRAKKFIGFWCGCLSQRHHLEDLGLRVDGRVISKITVKGIGWEVD
jgi:hypothetical protein